MNAIPETDQRALKAKPKNIADNLVRGLIFVNTTELRVNIAGGTATETPNLLTLSGQTVLSAKRDSEHGRVLISASIHDKAGTVIGRLVDNEWSMPPGAVWDFEAHPRHCTIRLAPRDVAFAVHVRGDIVSLQGKWFHDGRQIEFTPSQAKVGTSVFLGNSVLHCGTMIAVG